MARAVKRISGVILAFCSTQASGAMPKSVDIPETVVTISVFDLVGALPKKDAPPAPRLPEDYGKRVAQAILERRAELASCLGSDGTGRRQLAIHLEISGSGEGSASFGREGSQEAEDSVVGCLRDRLAQILYPMHSLKHSVSVQFPLLLERKVF